MLDLRKIYNFYPVDPSTLENGNIPSGGDIYYECLDCLVIVNSVPFIKTACACGNLSGQSGALSIKDSSRIQVVKGKLK